MLGSEIFLVAGLVDGRYVDLTTHDLTVSGTGYHA